MNGEEEVKTKYLAKEKLINKLSGRIRDQITRDWPSSKMYAECGTCGNLPIQCEAKCVRATPTTEELLRMRERLDVEVVKD